MMSANEAMSLGRNCLTADRAHMTVHADGWTVIRLEWRDGATNTTHFDTRGEAESYLRSLYFIG